MTSSKSGSEKSEPERTEPDTDWSAWHDRYADPTSPTSRRLALIQDLISHWLDETAPRFVRILSVCAGDGRDVIQVLAQRRDAQRVKAVLVEKDAENCARARADSAALPQVTVIEGDASQSDLFAAHVPADLVVIAGVFGNIRNRDVRTMIEALPQFCAHDGVVIWTRRRRPEGIIEAIADWFSAAGFVPTAYQPREQTTAFIGAHRFLGQPQPLVTGRRLFEFVR